MTEGRTSVGEPDAEVERTSTTTSTTSGTTPADRTDADEATTPAVGTTDEGGESGEPQPGDTVAAATLPGEDATDEGRHSAPAKDAKEDSDPDDDWADAEDKAYKRELRKGLAFGTAGGLVLGAIVALLLGAFVYPGYLGGPGNPEDTANQVVTALAAKDAPALEQISCKGPDGNAVAQLSPQVLQLIGSVRPSGPTTTVIDTEARTPVDLQLTYQGQSQTLPSEIVLGQAQGAWCLKGLAQRQ
ncbi:hypothetical protein [Actinomycetospora sp. CA-084318]|uniref:hypothetical protein n=1 Tax=Actinomycetospora sp. CA-084318 TaxID=3239892 RepID=UPI003D95F9FA